MSSEDRPLPPGRTEAVRSRRTLVVAPHYDDEVLGCGGLLAQLAAAATEVEVLFLSDGAGGVEAVADRPAYAARRRAEAEAAAEVLGLARLHHLGLPDGRLAQHLAEIRAALAAHLEARCPDLLLVPSPLEATADHRAAFAALHGVLTGVRDGSPLAPAVAELRVLAYEVNHPGRPDLLVDVGAELPAIERAMARYASQEERHPYHRAALGLRRFRTLSLGPGVAAAEAYRRLSLEDFTTRSLAGLVRHLGGDPETLAVTEGPPVSVVVRTRDRPALLAEALASLAAGTYRNVELVLVNDGGATPSLDPDYPFPVERRELNPGRGRAAAANAGLEAASGELVGFLDDDDRLEPEHLETLVGLLTGSGARAAYTDAAVGLYEPDAERGWRCVERRLPYSRDFDAELLALDNYIPFHTLLAERQLYREAGRFDDELPFFEDWDMLIRLARLAAFQHLARVTCEYRHFRGAGHQVLGERPTERPDFLAVKARVLAKHGGQRAPEAVARAVGRLRAEAVAGAEAARQARHEAAGLRERLWTVEEEVGRLRVRVAELEARPLQRLARWLRRRRS